jgi:alkanesulfonate monooxygenase SsuD/methylene tetrahydromethanopterin reductase-like flavin-dependent oxidoreductase (luciferase family)
MHYEPFEMGLLLCSQFPIEKDAEGCFNEQIEQVRFVRDAGFGSVFASQHYLAHPFQYLHPLPVLARIIPELGDMRIGTSIALLALPSPVDLAEQLATLDVISGGRLTFGAGLGYRSVEFDAFGVPTGKQLRRFLDNLEVIREMWTQESVTFDSEHVRMVDVPIALRPTQRPHPPIWLAGHTDKAIRRAARLGIPWLAAAAHVDDTYLRHQVRLYREACTEFGNPNMALPMVQELYVAPSEERALEIVGKSLSVKYRAYQAWGQDKILPDDQSFDREFDDLRKGRFIIGDPAQCVARINELVADTGASHLLLRMQWPGMTHEDTMASMELFAEKVMPSLDVVPRRPH